MAISNAKSALQYAPPGAVSPSHTRQLWPKERDCEPGRGRRWGLGGQGKGGGQLVGWMRLVGWQGEGGGPRAAGWQGDELGTVGGLGESGGPEAAGLQAGLEQRFPLSLSQDCFTPPFSQRFINSAVSAQPLRSLIPSPTTGSPPSPVVDALGPCLVPCLYGGFALIPAPGVATLGQTPLQAGQARI